MMTSAVEKIVLTVATHPQVALGGVMLFYAMCAALAALPLKPRVKVPEAELPKSA